VVSRRSVVPSALAAALALAAPASAQASACPGADLVPSAANAARVRAATACLIDRERAKRGLARLRVDGSLAAMAGRYARTMVAQRFFGHTAPGGGTLERRVRATAFAGAGVQSWSVGEDLGWATGPLATPRQQVAAWMASPPHRENILEPSFRSIGIGVATGVPVSGVAAAGGATYAAEFGVHHRW
jgi:uncharacterized protein YkwD